MKIKTLELEAFGPYLEKQYLDFASLNDAELFLVTGDTGAGKTTIFDAICFALYGVSSGDTRVANQFRNQKASADVETYVKLTFTIRGHEYIITRYPNYLRDGYKTETRHKVYLEGVEDYAIEGVNEVATKIKEIIGVDANEFRQVAMIAQGQFTKLIQATSREREAILRELFATHAYASFQERLKKAEREKKDAYQQEKMKLDTYVEAIEELQDEEPLDFLKERMTKLEHLLVAQNQAQSIYQEDNLKLSKQLEESLALAQLYEQLDSLNMKYQNHLENEDDMKLLAQKIELLQMVDNVSKEETKYLDAQKIASDVAKRYQNALSQKQVLEAVHQEILDEASHIKQIEETLKETETKLQKIDEDLDKVEKVEKARNLAGMALKQKHVAQENVDKSLNQKHELENIIQRCQSDLKALSNLDALQTELAHESTRLDLEKQKLKKLQDTKQRVNDLTQTLQTHQAKWEKATSKQRELSDQKLCMEKQYQANMAGLLAKDLQEDMPCPVCGSLHHPKLAVYEIEGVTSETLDDISKELNAITSEVQSSFGDLMGVKQVLDLEKKHYLEALDGKDYDTLEKLYHEDFATYERNKQTCQEGYQRVEKLEAYLQDYTKRLEKWQEKHTKLEATLQATQENLVKRNEQFEMLQGSFHSAFEGLEVLVKRKTQLTKSIRELSVEIERYQNKAQKYALDAMQNQGELRALTSEHQKDQEHLRQTKASYDNALTNASMNEEAYHLALPTLTSLEPLTKQHQAYLQQKAILEKQIGDIKTSINDQELPDIEKIRASKKETEDKLKEVSLALEKNKWQLDHLSKQYEDIARASETFKQAENAYQRIYNVSRLASGQNNMRMTFESYILIAYFEAILQRANLRLTAMTSGRYALMRKDESQGGRALQGLDLDVMDYESGKPRDVRTLSGGEAFKAALSLALGMADLISESAGGIELDTLFIDEGFGSLDERSLEMALDTLVELKQEHKVVGIISHVAALKERLQAKITVSHQKNTSMAKIS